MVVESHSVSLQSDQARSRGVAQDHAATRTAGAVKECCHRSSKAVLPPMKQSCCSLAVQAQVATQLSRATATKHTMSAKGIWFASQHATKTVPSTHQQHKQILRKGKTWSLAALQHELHNSKYPTTAPYQKNRLHGSRRCCSAQGATRRLRQGDISGNT
jgi:hypothetical protein